MPSPLPLNFYPQSGLTFSWAFTGDSNMSLGPDGAFWTERMQINWYELQTAITELLGFSYRDASTVGLLGVPQLRRNLPWQHPYFNQLYVHSISNIYGLRMQGTNSQSVGPQFIGHNGGGVGAGTPINLGPWTEYERANIDIKFWRPPYMILSDSAVRNTATGLQQEWLRYVDRHWSMSSQILTREGSNFVWSGSPANSGQSGYTTGLPGNVGQPVFHQKVSRKWYQIPEAAIFQTGQGILGTTQLGLPNGQARNLMYAATAVYNPITGYRYGGNYMTPIINTVNSPIGGGLISLVGTTTAGSAVITMPSTAGLTARSSTYDGDAVFGAGIPTGASIVSIVNNTSITITQQAYQTGTVSVYAISDADEANRMFGAWMGTLRYDNVTVTERPLQLPPYLMLIPIIASNEAISQVQYDVEFHFDLFDPPRPQLGSGSYAAGNARGHNLLPWSGNGLWYPVNSRKDASNGVTGPFVTPFGYSDFTDLFQIL